MQKGEFCFACNEMKGIVDSFAQKGILFEKETNKQLRFLNMI